jgi:hypothetical protein
VAGGASASRDEEGRVVSEWRPDDDGGVGGAPGKGCDDSAPPVPTGVCRTTQDILRDCLRLAAGAARIAERLERERAGARTWVVSSEPECWGPEVTESTAMVIRRHLAAVERLSGRHVLVTVLPPRYTERSCRDLAGVVQRLLDAWPQGPRGEL